MLLEGLLIALWIILPAVVVARQEIAIEGPFGWSAVTFTKRFIEDHWFSKFFRGLAGQDKWATSYHLNANLAWLFLYFGWIFLAPIWWHLVGEIALGKLLYLAVISLCASLIYMCAEDFYWFLLNPYYGLKHFNRKYIPWHQDYTGGLPSGYIRALVATVVLVALISWAKQDFYLLQLWATVLIFVFLFTGLLAVATRKMTRKPLHPNWWLPIEAVSIKRQPYPSEGRSPDKLPRVKVLVSAGPRWMKFEKYLSESENN